MAKNNIRSIRFSDELTELIDRQAGSSFTEKFENLISRCVWEIPANPRHVSAGVGDEPLPNMVRRLFFSEQEAV